MAPAHFKTTDGGGRKVVKGPFSEDAGGEQLKVSKMVKTASTTLPHGVVSEE